MSNDCIFCRIINKDIPADVLYEDEDYLVFKDINPSAPVHCLIIPKKHIASVNEIKEEDKEVTGGMYIVAQKVAEKLGVKRSGYKLTVNVEKGGGQEVFHIHMHFLSNLN